MYSKLASIFSRPGPHEFSNPTDMWNDPHISKRMLELHLNQENEAASRKTEFINRSVEWLKEITGIHSGTRVLDLGCGPGLYAVRLARAGAIVTGIDVSENSVMYARKQASESGLEIKYINDDYTQTDFDGRFDLAIMVYNDFSVLPPEDRKVLLKKIFSALENNGVLVFDVFSESYFRSAQERNSCRHFGSGGFWSAEPHFLFENVFKYEEQLLVLEKNTVIEAGRMLTIHNYLQCFSPKGIRAELAECGFGSVEVFGNIAGAPCAEENHEMALVARKQ